jgi:hypothetical protein
MTLRSSIFLVVAAFALTIPGTSGQERLLSQEDALGIARTLNTAEVEFFAQSKHAVDLQSLRSHRFIQKLDWGANPNSFSAKGYDVRLALTSDPTQYTLTILPKPEQWKSGACAPIYVTNESGIIFIGTALGCESTRGGQ